MKKRLKLRPFVFPTVYMILVLVLLGVVYYNGLISSSYSNDLLSDDFRYVTNLDFSTTIDVAKKEEVMVKPYTNEKVTIGKNYYDYQESNLNQENSIVYYEGTYIQNSGVDYVLNEKFDVVSCLEGAVVKAEKTDLMGYVVEIRYNNDLIDNGGFCWFAARYTSSSTNGVNWSPNSRSVYSNLNAEAYGLRPVISLSSSVVVTGGAGTMDDPYTIKKIV